MTLARTSSFPETEWEPFLAHSAISHSVRALEDGLGCRLSNRLGKTIELNAGGESFLHYAPAVLKVLLKPQQPLGVGTCLPQ